MDNKFLTLIREGICDNWEQPAVTNLQHKTYLYKEFAAEIAKLHILFETLELKKGEKVALCDKNSAHWTIALFATLGYGAVATTILNDFNGESIENIVNHSEAKILFLGEQTIAKLDFKNIPNVKTIIKLEDFSIVLSDSQAGKDLQSNIETVFQEKYPNGFTKNDVVFHIEDSEELAMLNYTSGTTSAPKGVMIPYRSLWSNTRFAIDNISFVKAGDGVVCMLPMAHMYGLAFEILLSIAKGCHIHFLSRPPSPQVILEAFAQVNPTLVLTVPLIIEKIVQNKVFPQLKKFPTNILTKIPGIKGLIYNKVAKKLIPLFGNKLVEIVIGGAALNNEVGAFLTAIKFPYTVGYGMTECGPLISYAYWTDYAPASCGKVVDRMQVTIDSEDQANTVGEILTRGDNVMLGYYKNSEATEAAFNNEGWLKTGDLGVIDSKGNIFIKGRSKTMILGPSGQNIYPEEIEDYFNNSPYVGESLIIEENSKLIALIYPNKAYMEEHGINEDDYDKIFREELKQINKALPNYSQVVNFRIQEQEFEKTPKRSIKRFLYQQ